MTKNRISTRLTAMAGILLICFLFFTAMAQRVSMYALKHLRILNNAVVIKLMLYAMNP